MTNTVHESIHNIVGGTSTIKIDENSNDVTAHNSGYRSYVINFDRTVNEFTIH